MSNSNDSLDKRLREWSAGQTPTGEQRDALCDRIVGALETCEPSPDHIDPGRTDGKTFLRGWHIGALSFGIGAALAACLCWILLSPEPAAPPTAAIDATSIAALHKDQLEASAKVFGEMLRMFAGQLNWLVESNGTVELGISTDPGSAPSSDARPIAIRILVVSRDKGEREWKPAWTADVLTFEEQQVVLADGDRRPAVNLWSHRLPDQAMAIDTSLTPAGTDKPMVTTAVLAPAGRPVEVLSGSTARREFRVFQSVSNLALK